MNRPFKYAGENADILIMGNSRAMHYDEDILSKELGLKCRNIGWIGFPFIYQYHGIFRTYMNRNIPPKYIIQEITPKLFFTKLKSPYLMEMLSRISEPEYAFFREMTPKISFSDYFLLPRYAGKIKEVFKKIRFLRNASHPIPLPNEYNAKPTCLQLPTILKNGNNERLDQDETSITLFKHYLDECETMNIKVILICSPFHTQDGLPKFDMDNFGSLIDSIKVGHDVAVLHYEERFGNDTTLFRDPSHLNNDGEKNTHI